MRLLPYSLQMRFLLGLVIIVLIIGVFFTLLLRHHIKELFVSEAHSKADLMVAHVESIQDYVRTVLRPLTSELVGPDEFLIEAMSSSYVSRRILSNLDLDDRDFTYRRVARNARNPDYEVNEQEALFFDSFANDPQALRAEEIVQDKGGVQLVIARPVHFSQSCMRCHGDPADAPAVLVEMYGAERGFFRSQDELAGLDIISVNLNSASTAISSPIKLFALFFSLCILLLLFSVQGFFNRLVVHNLGRVSYILQQKFQREDDQKILAPLREATEIEDMITSIEGVAAHLSEARQQLGAYAKNLELMVQERTADLERILTARSADVNVFMRLLSDLNSNKDKKTLLGAALGLIARHFGADQAMYLCGISGLDYLEWPEPDPERQQARQVALADQLCRGQPLQSPTAWYVPVQSAGQTRGMLGLYWQADPVASGALEATASSGFRFALSLGSQLGIALDNLDALDALLRQNSLLGAVVEGVNYPLILVEQDLHPVLTNSPAQKLAQELGPLATPESSANQAEPKDPIRALLELLELKPDCNGELSSLQYEVILACGRSFMVNVHPFSNSGRNALQAVIHLRETTEEKRILSHLRQTEKLATVGELAAGLAHEINNPLGVIRCYSELLCASTTDGQNIEDLSIILRHVEQAQTVVNSILNFARQHEPNPSNHSLEQLLRHLVAIYLPQAATAKVDLQLDMQPDLPEIYLDKSMLEQIIVNLLLNGLDAAHKAHPLGGGELILQARTVGAQVVITVLDNGPGVPEPLLSKIFDPFFTTKEPGKGTGLGLSIAFGLANDLGGRLEVESPRPGPHKRGAAFQLTLPLGLNEHD